MKMNPPAVDPRLDPKRDGDKLPRGAHVYQKGKPITILHDDGMLYLYVEGHQHIHAANDRSGLSVEEPK